MKILITPDASEVIYSNQSDPAVLKLVGNVMTFEKSLAYRKHLFLAKEHPYLKPVTFLHNGALAMEHNIADKTILLFCPPEKDVRKITDDYIGKQLAFSSELNFI